jgi:hypothetical protein
MPMGKEYEPLTIDELRGAAERNATSLWEMFVRSNSLRALQGIKHDPDKGRVDPRLMFELFALSPRLLRNFKTPSRVKDFSILPFEVDPVPVFRPRGAYLRGSVLYNVSGVTDMEKGLLVDEKFQAIGAQIDRKGDIRVFRYSFRRPKDREHGFWSVSGQVDPIHKEEWENDPMLMERLVNEVLEQPRATP